MAPLLVSALFCASALAWVGYFRWKDRRRPEPWVLLLLVLGGGAAAALLALAGFDRLEALGVGTAWEDVAGPTLRRSLGAALRIGGVEEVAKLLPVLLLALTDRHFDEVLDGIVYAACAGVGFALAENAVMWSGGALGAQEAVARALAAPLTHALLAAPAGLGLALAVLRRRPWALALPMGLALSAAAHALYDWLLAQPGLPPGVHTFVVLALWVWLMRMSPKLARLPPRAASSAAARG
ncbi:PrsW family intramembrane metalloprotease [Aggregicoccus sp. 17bor-14]|uniref:PrsW family glutamic-type intramembrane protease n=1 Tax=Myxococcaceae TaxID=31 RepID=UPI00129C3B2A|nr:MULTISPECIES: PrsW family glutamic-type intramembrane protease [Myxococcaceae]MBF5041840.1 PrsW family intramembrane metalloprotease [Simulacricoccus sp. 17bor-14]MRI87621.1 PrsW family intramembrane metalloprotease [Aggregicoccus sp. 17bor-14]